MTPAAADAEIERINALADMAFAHHPGKPLTASQAEAVRRLLPEPSAGQQAA